MKTKLPKTLYVILNGNAIDATGAEATYVTKKLAKTELVHCDEGCRLGKYSLVEEIKPKKSK